MNGENPFVIYLDIVVNFVEILCVPPYQLNYSFSLGPI